jgi:excisionase family DNA binding protein
MGIPSRPSQSIRGSQSVKREGFRPAAPPPPSPLPPPLPPGLSPKQPRQLRVAQMAARLNAKERTVQLWCDIGYIPKAYKLGREWRVDEEDFNAWLEKIKKVED